MAPTKKDAKSEADQHTIADGEQNAGTQDTEVIDIYSLAVKSMKEVSTISASLPQGQVYADNFASSR